MLATATYTTKSLSQSGIISTPCQGRSIFHRSPRYHHACIRPRSTGTSQRSLTVSEVILRADRLGNDTASTGSSSPASCAANCPVCGGTGFKPCGQCNGTGVNQDDLFGGRYKIGDPCWLCSGKAKTMCGNCMDLTDAF